MERLLLSARWWENLRAEWRAERMGVDWVDTRAGMMGASRAV
jgi:hypothetical protein